MRAALLLAVDEAESAEKAAKCTLFTNHHVKTKMAKLELEIGSQALDVCLRVVFGMPKFGEGTDGLGVNVKTPSGDKEQLQETANALAVPTPAAVPSLYPQMPPPYGVNTGVIPLSPQKRETKRAPTELPPSAYTMAPVRVVEGGVLHGVMQLTGGQLTVKDDSLSEATQILTGTVETVQDGGHEGHRSRRETPSCSASGSVKMHRSPSPDGAKGGPASAHAFEGRIRERRSSLGDHTPWGKGYTWTRSKQNPSMTRTLLPSERWDLSSPLKKGAPVLHHSDDEWEKETQDWDKHQYRSGHSEEEGEKGEEKEGVHAINGILHGSATPMRTRGHHERMKEAQKREEARQEERPAYSLPLRQAPGQSPGMCDFHPWGFADMTGLIEGLPPLTSGATPWIEAFETLTMGNNLAAGDLRPVLARCTDPPRLRGKQQRLPRQ
ncbi:unnamed protein product [Pleuronectes platessa]|uniref:Uncharacterized protein n=1 Tax=Pleuronectes platessa TaxID=8262 RepID=A0A9N7U0J6_PLEPL|nr:unnamed protein product [Pleuronectes platessa]